MPLCSSLSEGRWGIHQPPEPSQIPGAPASEIQAILVAEAMPMPAHQLAMLLATLLWAMVGAAVVREVVSGGSARRAARSGDGRGRADDVPLTRAIVALSGALIAGIGTVGVVLVLGDDTPLANLTVPAVVVAAGCALVAGAVFGFGWAAQLGSGPLGKAALAGGGALLVTALAFGMSFEAGSGFPRYRRDADSRCKPGHTIEGEPGPGRGTTRPEPPPRRVTLGTIRWSKRLPPTSVAPAVGGGLVVTSVGEEVVALDLVSGAERWRRRPPTFSPRVDSVAVTPGRVHVATSSDAVVLDGADGRVIGEYEAGLVGDKLVAGIEAVYSRGFFTEVLASDAQTGRTRWSADFQDSVLGGPVPGEGVVAAVTGGGVVGEPATVIALNGADGTVLWRRLLPAGVQADPAAGHSQIYVADTDGVLHTFDAATGRPRWQFRLRGRDEHSASPVVGERWVYATDEAGIVSALDPGTGRERWCRGFAGSELIPVEAGGVVYVGEADRAGGVVHALDASVGAPRGTVRFPATLAGPPRATANEVVVALSDGVVSVVAVKTR